MKRRRPGAFSSSFVFIRAHSWIALVSFIFSWNALAHGTEFVLAKLQFDGAGAVRLEMTADYGQNPLIPDEVAARDVLTHVLRVREGDGYRELSGLRFEKREKPDPSAPVPTSTPGEDSPHELLTAVWEGEPADHALAFEVKDHSPHDVVLWTDAGAAGGKTKWMMLISGDRSPVIAVPGRRSRWKSAWLWGGGVAAMVMVGLVWRFSRGAVNQGD